MGLPVQVLDRKGVQTGTQASKLNYEPSDGITRQQRPPAKGTQCLASTRNLNDAGNLIASRVQHVMDMP